MGLSITSYIGKDSTKDSSKNHMETTTIESLYVHRTHIRRVYMKLPYSWPTVCLLDTTG